MNYELIQTAIIIRYSYLWAREAGHGETEGRKERPVAVGVRMPRPDGDLVLFFPMTTKQPEAARFAVEVPAIEKRRAGFDADRRLWIIFDEFNTDIVGNSFYLEPEPPTGRFSKAFFLPLLREFIRRRKSATEVSRFR
ncbi:hypothetical protein [Rhizobium leguminosarum]|jgi:hypothetical protein|uniref:Uncharacterized protein n=1 Tax=Rhizobium leguminosarum TaxID=384 RepID=A0A4Q8XSN3_RHILE|nr:hypothetical protein [Rhizobium leguminosarum]TAV43616.1 hypothetical protein ELI29_30845 [Rhizobium leguminosarum]TAV82684.1 hypothetical protein ELI21_29375 [Rhizobium leguminosarum]TAV83499.1 hypothetical protein ELI22_29785 [Rhizobium leguminosarum]TAW14060.1 hypothetical protein ELI19_33300 [Rhizobium leguminosarum]TAW26293.1 hypothetical protein ELI23_29420 [Rhizobium leguminosarum]